MKRTIILATAATAMLTGCVKTEVNPVAVPEQEISYQAVVGPKTKALDPNGFSKANKFVSYAYFLPADKNWTDNIGEAQVYIDGVEIFYKDGSWKEHGTPHYWPKDGSLAFYAWSINRDNVTLQGGHEIKCNTTEGIKAENYSAVQNKNADFMVADIRTGETVNTKPGTYETEGVPTLFRHKLCQVKYNVKVNHAYANTDFELNRITLTNISQSGTYTQCRDDLWTASTAKEDYTYESSKTNPTSRVWLPEPVTGTEYAGYPEESSWTQGGDQFYFIPQSLTEDNLLKIEYTICTKVGEGVVENKVSGEYSLSILFGDKLKKNTKYTINITIGLNEILWDPDIEDWGNTNGNWDLIDSGTTVEEGAGA